MLITLSCRTAIYLSVAEIWLTGVVPLGAVSHKFNVFIDLIIDSDAYDFLKIELHCSNFKRLV